MKESKVRKVYRNICLTEYGVKEVQDARKEINDLSNRVNNIENKINDISSKIETIYKNSNELIYRNRFIDSTKNSEWLNIPLSLSDYSIGYDFAYILFTILNQIKPKNILELGLGQSTKIVNEYMKNTKNGNEHHVVEHNKDWIEFFKGNIELSKKTKIHLLDNKVIPFKGSKINSYKDFDKEFNNNKFDLIMVDGPNGNGQEYSRTDILKIIPKCLNDSFIILIDDANRIGEQNTAKELEKILDKNNIEYACGIPFLGITNVYICVSKDLSFLLTI